MPMALLAEGEACVTVRSINMSLLAEGEVGAFARDVSETNNHTRNLH